ncbi:MAG: hypothetical protein LAT67_10935 [Balneolales bacterium]|nr:hypothetical protein [Balneolales bacterium]
MITIFKKLRNSKVGENNVRHYFFYALGELFLVVVGILIALQINNWNENRKDGIRELGLIESLITDLRNDKMTLEFLLEFNENKVKGLDSLLALHSRDLRNPDHKDAFYLLNSRYLMSVGNFRPITRTWGLLESTGGLSVIQKDVANRLSVFQQALKAMQNQGVYMENAVFDTFDLTAQLIPLFYLNDTDYFKDGKLTDMALPEIQQNEAVLLTYFNKVNFARSVLNFYISDAYLKGHLQRTEDLISFLEETYAIGEN